MRWIKRNIFLLIGIVLALGLMAGAIVFLVSTIQADVKASKSLKSAQSELISLMQSQPFPDQANLTLAQQETQRLVQFMAGVQTNITYPPVPKMTSQEFSSYLLNTVADLQKGAEQAGVQLPAPRYAFSFEPLVQQVNFDAASIEPLTRQLMEVRELCTNLFQSQIHKLESLRRVRVSTLDPAQGPHYLDKAVNPAAYNNLASVTPYEIVFTGFSTELAGVLERLQRSPIFFSVKLINMETMKSAAPVAAPVPTAAAPAPAVGAAAKGKAKAADSTPVKDEIYLFEQPLKIHLFIEVVRLNQAQAAK
ncbi:MAG TPA: Amuc_1100 family pilus-like protein [Verrucomicrobiae bacterium]